jgi:predicted RNA-binding Zn ribbon-like protein
VSTVRPSPETAPDQRPECTCPPELCLAFVNTLPDRPRCQEETLSSYADLLEWARTRDVVNAEVATDLEQTAAADPDAAAAALERARALREVLFRLLTGAAVAARPAVEDLEALNRALADAMPKARVAVQEGRFHWAWCCAEQDLDRPVWPVVRSAAELLASDEIGKVRQCAADGCSWLFVDRSRGGRRRWCSMATCGNRAKARRHYRRTRQET